MPRLIVLVAIMLSTICGMAAQADVITDWNQNAIEVLKSANVAGNPWSRALAMVHVAMCDAVNSVQKRYARYASNAPTASGASADAAAVAAARNILTQVAPAQKSKIDEFYAESLSRIPD